MSRLNLLYAVAGLLALGGCAASASPAWDASFGERTRALTAQQLIDPAAPARHAQSTTGEAGRTVREAMDRHVDSYRSPPPNNVLTIGISPGSSQ